jgi:hypothetical protein
MREPLAAQRQLATKTNPKTKGFSNCRLRLSCVLGMLSSLEVQVLRPT